MKKILLASTILVGTAGFAAADNANFTWSGAAYVGVGVAIGANEAAGEDLDLDGITGETGVNVFRPELTSSFKAAMMTTTDMGLDAGASIEVTADGASFETDHTDDAFGTFSEGAEGISNSSVYLSGEWGKLAVAYDNDGSGVGTSGTDWDMVFTYSHSFGDFGISAYYTIAIDGATGTNGDMGAKGTYSFGDYSLYASVDYDASDDGGVDSPLTFDFGGSATFMDFTLGANIEYNVDNDGAATTTADIDWKVTADYATGAYSVGVFAEDDGIDDNVDFGAHASYDLGGGVSVDASYIYDQDGVDNGGALGLAQLGVSMSF